MAAALVKVTSLPLSLERTVYDVPTCGLTDTTSLTIFCQALPGPIPADPVPEST
jgi:hypothetical protein